MSNVSRNKETFGGVVPDIQARKEPDILQLSRRRSTAKGNLNKKKKGLTEWQITRGNIGEAQEKMAEFADVGNKFYVAHSKYHSIIEDENDVVDSKEYLEKESKRIENFKSSFKDWIQRLQIIDSSEQDNVRPSDSISNVGRKQRSSIQGSRSKVGSSLASAQIAARARRAALEAEKIELIKAQALEVERLQLEQRKQELELNKELAKVEAEERVYDAAMAGEYSMAKSYLSLISLMKNARFSAVKASGTTGREETPVEQMRTKQLVTQVPTQELLAMPVLSS